MLRVKRVSARITAWVQGSWLEAWALGAICASGLVLRYLVLLRYPAPPGADYGNYLTNLHAMFGDDVTGGGVQYPAFFLLYLAALVRIMGEIPALQFSGPFLAGLTGLPVYLFLRRYVPREYALLGSAMIVFSEGISEMASFSGHCSSLFFTTPSQRRHGGQDYWQPPALRCSPVATRCPWRFLVLLESSSWACSWL